MLDAGRVAHVAVVDEDGQPFVVPVAFARDGDQVIFHGSRASRLFKRLAAGAPTCLTVTHLDGLVLARSAFESSMNYRSVMVLGIAHELTGDAEVAAFERVTEHLLPGRWADVRPPSEQERKATMFLALSLDECSVKIRTGPPEDLDIDLADPVYRNTWAGVVPMHQVFDAPIAADDSTELPVPDYIQHWT